MNDDPLLCGYDVDTGDDFLGESSAFADEESWIACCYSNDDNNWGTMTSNKESRCEECLTACCHCSHPLLKDCFVKSVSFTVRSAGRNELSNHYHQQQSRTNLQCAQCNQQHSPSFQRPFQPVSLSDVLEMDYSNVFKPIESRPLDAADIHTTTVDKENKNVIEDNSLDDYASSDTSGYITNTPSPVAITWSDWPPTEFHKSQVLCNSETIRNGVVSDDEIDVVTNDDFDSISTISVVCEADEDDEEEYCDDSVYLPASMSICQHISDMHNYSSQRLLAPCRFVRHSSHDNNWRMIQNGASPAHASQKTRELHRQRKNQTSSLAFNRNKSDPMKGGLTKQQRKDMIRRKRHGRDSRDIHLLSNTERVLRDMHNNKERDRRREIADDLSGLRRVLPKNGCHRVSKKDTLQAAVEFIRQLERQSLLLKSQRSRLVDQYHQLQARLRYTSNTSAL